MTQTIPKLRPPSDNGKIHHFHIRKEIFKDYGQISKEIMEDQKLLIIIVEDLVILGKIYPNNNNNNNNKNN